MDWKELERKGRPELERILATEREHVRRLRFAVNQGQHKDVRELRQARHDVARLLTRLKQLDHTPSTPPTQS